MANTCDLCEKPKGNARDMCLHDAINADVNKEFCWGNYHGGGYNFYTCYAVDWKARGMKAEAALATMTAERDAAWAAGRDAAYSAATDEMDKCAFETVVRARSRVLFAIGNAKPEEP